MPSFKILRSIVCFKASSIFRTLTNLKFPLEKVVFGVNNELVEAKFKGMFVTAVFGKLNIKTGELVFINAGHESILTFDENNSFTFSLSLLWSLVSFVV